VIETPRKSIFTFSISIFFFGKILLEEKVGNDSLIVQWGKPSQNVFVELSNYPHQFWN